MRYNVLTYLIGEGFANIFKNKKQAATSFLTMCLIMIFFGVCFVLIGNINHFVTQVEAKQGIQVFILNDATDEEIEQFGTELQKLDGVNTIEFVDREQALESVKQRYGERSNMLNGIDASVFSTSYIITLTDLSLSSQVQAQIRQIDNVKEITSSDVVMEKLVKIASGIKTGSYIIVAALIIINIFIISNTIKLTVYARRKEISIMKYVGATNGFIRWPFIVEGVVIGLISGAISLALIAGMYLLMEQNVEFVTFLSRLGLSLLEFSQMFNMILIVYLVLGVGIGIIGSTLSMRKYLKV